MHYYVKNLAVFFSCGGVMHAEVGGKLMTKLDVLYYYIYIYIVFC